MNFNDIKTHSTSERMFMYAIYNVLVEDRDSKQYPRYEDITYDDNTNTIVLEHGYAGSKMKLHYENGYLHCDVIYSGDEIDMRAYAIGRAYINTLIGQKMPKVSNYIKYNINTDELDKSLSYKFSLHYGFDFSFLFNEDENIKINCVHLLVSLEDKKKFLNDTTFADYLVNFMFHHDCAMLEMFMPTHAYEATTRYAEIEKLFDKYVIQFRSSDSNGLMKIKIYGAKF